jgi:hypothetical protein
LTQLRKAASELTLNTFDPNVDYEYRVHGRQSGTPNKGVYGAEEKEQDAIDAATDIPLWTAVAAIYYRDDIFIHSGS